MAYYDNLINIKFPFLYNPPNGTPAAAAAVSSAKFNDELTCVSITYEPVIGFKYDAVEANDAVTAYDAVVAFGAPFIPEKLAIAFPVAANAKYNSAELLSIALIPAGITTKSFESYTSNVGYLVFKLCANDQVTAADV